MNNKWTMNHYMNRFRALANLTNCYELTYVWLWLWYGEAYPFLYEAIEAGRYTFYLRSPLIVTREVWNKKSLPAITQIPIGKVHPIKFNNSVTQLIVIISWRFRTLFISMSLISWHYSFYIQLKPESSPLSSLSSLKLNKWSGYGWNNEEMNGEESLQSRTISSAVNHAICISRFNSMYTTFSHF